MTCNKKDVRESVFFSWEKSGCAIGLIRALYTIIILRGLRKRLSKEKETNLHIKRRRIMKEKVIAVVNQKGGVAKTTTTLNLGAELVKAGKKVLLIDFDPQGSLSVALGVVNEEIPTIADLMQLEIEDQPLPERKEIILSMHGMDLIPANIVLSATEIYLVNATCREQILKTILSQYKKDYDYILIDCGPSLGMLTINALTAADSVIIPVDGEFLSAKGLELLLQSVARTKRKLNPDLSIEGILLTKIDTRTNLSKDIIGMIQEAYGKLHIFKSEIPLRVAVGKSIKEHKPIANFEKNSDATKSYQALAEEVLKNE